MPQNKFLRATTYIGAVMVIIGAISFIGGLWWTGEKAYLLDLGWEQDDAARHEKIMKKLENMESNLDYLMGFKDASRIPED